MAVHWCFSGRIFLGLSLLVVPAGSTAHAFQSPGDAQSALPGALLGVWEMEGQALIIETTEREVAYYDVTAVSCIESGRRPAADLSGRFSGGVVERNESWLTVRDHAQPYRLRRLAGLPQQCRNGGTVGADPVLNFETFWHYMVENYAGTEVRHLDWASIHAEFRPRITASTTPAQLWEIYRTILTRVDDVHVFMTNGRPGAENRSISAGRPSGLREALLRQNPNLSEDRSFELDSEMQHVLDRMVQHDVLHGRYSTALQNKFQWGWAAPRIGYLNIAMMMRLFEAPATDPAAVRAAVHETMQRVLGDFASADALIIDVRQNRGGSDDVAAEVASHFLNSPLTRRTRARTPSGYTSWWPRVVQPHGPRFSRPVYVLISANTVSAAELFALYMREAPNVTLVGETTRGAFSTILFKRLPDGSSIGIANEQAIGVRGEALETRGIQPDIRAPVFQPDRLVAGYRDAIDVVLRRARHAGARQRRQH